MYQPAARTIYVNRGREFVKVQEPKRPNSFNFVIVCDYGDWSGFRSIEECMKQFNELVNVNRPDGFYRVEERD